VKRRPPLYHSWIAMRRYCGFVGGATPYQRSLYEGVTVCPAWLDYREFEAWSMAHGWRKGLHLTRLDKKGDFCPDNCVWLDAARANGKRSCIRRLPDGRSARDIIGDGRLGLDHGRQRQVAFRLFNGGWDVEHALSHEKYRRPHTRVRTDEGPYDTWRFIRKACVTKGGLRAGDLRRYEGVELCTAWRDSYEAFARWCLDNGWRRGMFVVRRDKRGGYCPENCAVVARLHDVPYPGRRSVSQKSKGESK